MFIDTSKHYQGLYAKYGDSAKAVAWGNAESQNERLHLLMDVAGGIEGCEGSTILDYGCGTGALADLLKQNNVKPRSYTGVDIVNDFLSCAAIKHPQYKFCKQEAIGRETFDYIFISGTFNRLIEGEGANEAFFLQALRWCWEHCSRSIAFNLLSTYVDFQEQQLWYKAPEEVIRFIKTEFGHRTRFNMTNDYILTGGSIASEYTVHLFKQNQIALQEYCRAFDR
jgi:SAM-dependent methyltransferase